MAGITVEQAVRHTIGILNNIRIPVAFMKDIGEPITQAISNLNACCDAWQKEAENNISNTAEAEGSTQDADSCN